MVMGSGTWKTLKATPWASIAPKVTAEVTLNAVVPSEMS